MNEPIGVILDLGNLVEGLGVEPSQVNWIGHSLKERQERAFIGAKVRPGPDSINDERIVIAGDVALTALAVHLMLELGRQKSEVVSFIPGGELGLFYKEAKLGRTDFLAAYVPAGTDLKKTDLNLIKQVELDPKEKMFELPVPKEQFGAEILQIPLADALLFPMGHWVQVLWANLLGLGPFLWRELVGKTPPGFVWYVSKAAIKALSLDPYNIGAKLGKKGKACRIHPSAVVEGCWLGDAVEIGANAVVRGSILSDGVKIEDQAFVEFSVLGKRSIAQRQALIKFTVMDDDASCGGTIQLGVIGKSGAVKHGAILMDMSLGQKVRVLSQGALKDAPLGICGICVGSKAMVGSRVSIAPGRAIPPGVRVVAPLEGVLNKIPSSEPGTYTIIKGSLERL